VLPLSLPIQTERLCLRLFEDRDLEDLYAYHSDPRVTPYLYWDVRDRAQTRESLDYKRQQTDAGPDGGALCLAIERAGQVIGELSLRCLSRAHRQGEIGFVVAPAFWGQGFATEAARRIVDLGFTVFDFHRISGRCDARNAGSAGVMARLGMRREACFVENEIFKGEWGSELIYGILAREWPAPGR
jgi:RimJ/RimL family protein N-acetyltransferase